MQLTQKQPTEKERIHLIDLGLAMAQYLEQGDIKTAKSYAYMFNRVAHCHHADVKQLLDGWKCNNCKFENRGL